MSKASPIIKAVRQFACVPALEKEHFCFTTDLPACTVLENNNTNWSVFLSSQKDNRGEINNDIIAQLFVKLLTNNPLQSVIPDEVQQGSVTGILRKYPLSSPVIRKSEQSSQFQTFLTVC